MLVEKGNAANTHCKQKMLALAAAAVVLLASLLCVSTAYAEPADADCARALAAGMNEHLSKPLDMARLIDVLERCRDAEKS